MKIAISARVSRWRPGNLLPAKAYSILAFFEVLQYSLGMATVSEQLREALESCGQTRYLVSKNTGIPQSVLCRFVQGHALRGENLDILAAYLKLELRPIRGARKDS